MALLAAVGPLAETQGRRLLRHGRTSTDSGDSPPTFPSNVRHVRRDGSGRRVLGRGDADAGSSANCAAGRTARAEGAPGRANHRGDADGSCRRVADGSSDNRADNRSGR